jgi:hypothetical protein
MSSALALTRSALRESRRTLCRAWPARRSGGSSEEEAGEEEEGEEEEASGSSRPWAALAWDEGAAVGLA